MRIIDFHTHPFLDEGQRSAVYPGTVPDDAAGMKAQLLQSGITHICGCTFNRHGDGSLRAQNDFTLTLREHLGADFYTPGFHVHPRRVEESLVEIRRMNDAGLKLIGEIVPRADRPDSCGPCIDEWNTLLAEAGKYGMALNYHTIWPWSFDEVIAANPNVPIVAAHPGEKERVQEHIQRMRKYDNVYLDLSGTGIFRFGCIRHLVNHVGADRILFGTDYPICNPDMYIHAVLGEHLGDAVTEKIFYGNAARLLHL